MGFDDIRLIISVKDDGSAVLKSFQSTHRQTTTAVKSGNTSIGASFAQLNKFLPTTEAVFKRVFHSVARYAKLAVIALVGAAEEFARRSFNLAKDFEYAMAEVHTIIGRASVDMAKMKDQVLDLSVAIGQSGKVIAGGLYWAISSGIKAGEAMEFMNDASKIAVAGLTTVEVAADALTTVLNAYGLSIEHTMRISDQMFETVRIGKIRFEDIARTIGYGVTMAALLGVESSELMAAFAALTRVGFQANRAMTSLRSIFNQIITPTEGARAAAARYGIELSAGAVASMGFVNWLTDLRAKLMANTGSTSEMNEALATMFKDLRGVVGIMGLVGPAFDTFKASVEDITFRLGATEKAFATIANTVEFQLRRMKSSFQAEMIRMAYDALPVVKQVVEFVTENISQYFDLIKGIAQTVYESVYSIVDAMGAMPDRVKALNKDFSDTEQITLGIAEGLAGFSNAISKIGYVVTMIAGAFRGVGVVIQDIITLSLLLGSSMVNLIELVAVGLANAFNVVYRAIKYTLLWAIEKLMKGLDWLGRKVGIVKGPKETTMGVAMEKERRREGAELAGAVEWGGDAILEQARKSWNSLTFDVSVGMNQMKERGAALGIGLRDAAMRMSMAQVRMEMTLKSIADAAERAKQKRLNITESLKTVIDSALDHLKNSLGNFEEALKAKALAIDNLSKQIEGYTPYAEEYERFAAMYPGFKDKIDKATFAIQSAMGAYTITENSFKDSTTTWKDLGGIVAVTTKAAKEGVEETTAFFKAIPKRMQAYSGEIAHVATVLMDGVETNLQYNWEMVTGTRAIAAAFKEISMGEASKLMEEEQARQHAEDLKRLEELKIQYSHMASGYEEMKATQGAFVQSLEEGASRISFATKNVHVPLTNIADLVDDFSNRLNLTAQYIARICDRVDARVRETDKLRKAGYAEPEAMQHGGLVGGQEGMGDRVPLYAQPREFVMSTAAVDRFGPEFFESLNRLTAPASARGGQLNVEVVIVPSEDFVDQVILRGKETIIGVLDTNAKRIRKVLGVRS